MSTSIEPGEQIPVDPSDRTTLTFNWDTHLAEGVTLSGVGTFTVQAVTPREATPSLEVDNVSMVDGSRKVTFRLVGGRRGTLYRVSHLVSTSESPEQRRERSFEVMVQDR